jgi:hypothetical protein
MINLSYSQMIMIYVKTCFLRLDFFLLKPLSSHITKRTFKEVRITESSSDQKHMETTEIEPVKNTSVVS